MIVAENAVRLFVFLNGAFEEVERAVVFVIDQIFKVVLKRNP